MGNPMIGNFLSGIKKLTETKRKIYIKGFSFVFLLPWKRQPGCRTTPSKSSPTDLSISGQVLIHIQAGFIYKFLENILMSFFMVRFSRSYLLLLPYCQVSLVYFTGIYLHTPYFTFLFLLCLINSASRRKNLYFSSLPYYFSAHFYRFSSIRQSP
jgi:hypothetical protein